MQELQGKTKKEIIALTHKKEKWTDVEVRTVVSTMKNSSFLEVINDEIKIGDIIANTITHHPVVVIKIMGDRIWGCTTTSNPECCGVILKCESRFMNTWFTSCVIELNREQILKSVAGTFENNVQIRQLNKLLKKHYSELFRK